MKMFSYKEEHLDTELNIVPIIDCFVMLICFLLFTAAFTQLVFLEAKMTTNTAVAAQKSRSELDQFRLVVTFEDQGLRLGTNVRLDIADNNVGVGFALFAAGFEHGIGLANARCRAEEDFQLAPSALLARFFTLDSSQQRIGIRSVFSRHTTLLS